MDRKRRVVIVGGGIAGLACAFFSCKKAAELGQPIDVTVLEKSDRWGGTILTEQVDGFVIEGGPDAFLVTKPWAKDLCHELGLESELQGTIADQANTYILRKGQLRLIPKGLTMMIPTRFGPILRSGLLSWPAKARMAMDLLIPARKIEGDESLRSFISRRLGREAYEILVGPLMSGIYAGDGSKLSLQATFPILRDIELEYGGLIRGAIALSRKRTTSGTGSIFQAPVTGMETLVKTLVKKLQSSGVDLRLGAKVHKITQANGLYKLAMEQGEEIRASNVVLATPAFITRDLVMNLNHELTTELDHIKYVSSATVSLAYLKTDLSQPLNGHGYIIPHQEGRKALACTWTSSKWLHRAPANTVLLRVYIGSALSEQELSEDDEELLTIAVREVQETLGINTKPIITRIFRWDRALPQYNLGHPERLERIDAALKRLPGLSFAGSAYSGVGIPDCIHSGQLAAERIIWN